MTNNDAGARFEPMIGRRAMWQSSVILTRMSTLSILTFLGAVESCTTKHQQCKSFTEVPLSVITTMRERLTSHPKAVLWWHSRLERICVMVFCSVQQQCTRVVAHFHHSSDSARAYVWWYFIKFSNKNRRMMAIHPVHKQDHTCDDTSSSSSTRSYVWWYFINFSNNCSLGIEARAQVRWYFEVLHSNTGDV